MNKQMVSTFGQSEQEHLGDKCVFLSAKLFLDFTVLTRASTNFYFHYLCFPNNELLFNKQNFKTFCCDEDDVLKPKTSNSQSAMVFNED